MMEIAKLLDDLEIRFEDVDPDEHRNEIIPALTEIHLKAGEEEDTFNRFIMQVADRFGGIYIPYIFWDKLSEFLEAPLERAYLFEITKAFANSNFYEIDQRNMKPLLITYFAKEKQFEINKMIALLFDKSHPTVKEYFHKLIQFVEKNKKSTEMYCEKFDILKNIHPNFDLMALPITQLKDRFQEA